MKLKPRQAKRTIAPAADAPKGPAKGSLVQYHDEGLRAGWLESINGPLAIVQPIGAKGVAKPRLKRIPLVELVLPNERAHRGGSGGASQNG